MRRNIYELASYHTFAANTTTRVEVPSSGYITRIQCLLHLNVTAATPTAAEDPMARVVKGCRVRASGGRNYFDVTAGRQWKVWNHFKFRGQIQESAMPTGTSTADCYFELPIQYGLRVTDPFGASPLIPARKLTNIVHEVTWGASADLGTGLTINSGDMKLVIHELTLEPGEVEQDFWPRGILEPRFEARQISIGATYSNLGLEDEVPVGDIIHETAILVLNSSGNRSDADVTQVGVKFPKRRETPIDRSWATLKAASRSQFGVPADFVGSSLFHWGWVSGRGIGVPLKLAFRGDCKMGFSTGATGGTLHLLHYCVGLAA